MEDGRSLIPLKKRLFAGWLRMLANRGYVPARGTIQNQWLMADCGDTSLECGGLRRHHSANERSKAKQ
jgi:hypothetical protein